MVERLFELLHPSNIADDEKSYSIYGIFDGVKYPMLWSDLEESVVTYDMLFREEDLRIEMEEVAPFLVELDFESKAGIEKTKELLECYGKGGCIFMASYLDFSSILEAMRELFYVYTPEGEKGYMRFYDPKIFSKYIAQRDFNITYALFSDVNCYWCEDSEDTHKLRQYIKESTYGFVEEIFILREKV